jgi:hypothetical protein
MDNTLAISHIDPNLMWEPMMYVGVVISVYDQIIADGKYLFDFHVLTAKGKQYDTQLLWSWSSVPCKDAWLQQEVAIIQFFYVVT